MLYQLSYGPAGASLCRRAASNTRKLSDPPASLNFMTPSEIGERTEAAVLAALVASGKYVLLPFGGQRRYDLAYEEDGRLVKVQCKTGRIRNGALWFRTHSVVRGSIRDYRTDVDFFGVYSHERGEVYLVPVASVPARAAHLRLDPARNRQQLGIRWAPRYLLSGGGAADPLESGQALHQQLAID